MGEFKGTKSKDGFEVWHHGNSTKSGLRSLGKEDGVRMIEADGCFSPHFTVSTGQFTDHMKHNIQVSWIGAHICELNYPPNGKSRGFSEQKENAKLIAEAFNVRQQIPFSLTDLLQNYKALSENSQSQKQTFDTLMKKYKSLEQKFNKLKEENKALKRKAVRIEKANHPYGVFFDRVISDGEKPEYVAKDLKLLLL